MIVLNQVQNDQRDTNIKSANIHGNDFDDHNSAINNTAFNICALRILESTVMDQRKTDRYRYRDTIGNATHRKRDTSERRHCVLTR